MELLLRQFQRCLSIGNKCIQPSIIHNTSLPVNGIAGRALFHTSKLDAMPYNPPQGPKKWPIYNKKMFPPQLPGEEKRPAVIAFL